VGEPFIPPPTHAEDRILLGRSSLRGRFSVPEDASLLQGIGIEIVDPDVTP
jgi:hypothetical protein